jgi:hypothetical protein
MSSNITDCAAVDAAVKHVESLTPDEAIVGGYPMWFGGSVREAFLAGAKWQAARKPKPKRKGGRRG